MSETDQTQAERDATGAWIAWKVARLRADAALDHALHMDRLADAGRPIDPEYLDMIIASAGPPGGCTCQVVDRPGLLGTVT